VFGGGLFIFLLTTIVCFHFFLIVINRFWFPTDVTFAIKKGNRKGLSQQGVLHFFKQADIKVLIDLFLVQKYNCL